MSSNIPANWVGYNLADWTPVYAQGAFYGDILWNELKVDKPSLNRFRLSSEQPSAAEFLWITDFNTINNVDAFNTLGISILGGYDPTAFTMQPPLAHPQNPQLFATDMEIVPIHTDNTKIDVTGHPAFYRNAICKVSFQSLPYPVDGDQAWMEWRSFSNNDRLTSPLGQFIWSGGAYTGKTAALGTVFTAGASYITLIMHRLPEEVVFNTGSINRYAVNCGSVNDAAWFGYAQDTLLLDSVQCTPFGDFLGQNIYDVNLNFIYRNNPNWFESIDKDGAVNSITFTNGNDPYDEVDFDTEFNGTIP